MFGKLALAASCERILLDLKGHGAARDLPRRVRGAEQERTEGTSTVSNKLEPLPDK